MSLRMPAHTNTHQSESRSYSLEKKMKTTKQKNGQNEHTHTKKKVVCKDNDGYGNDDNKVNRNHTDEVCTTFLGLGVNATFYMLLLLLLLLHSDINNTYTSRFFLLWSLHICSVCRLALTHSLAHSLRHHSQLHIANVFLYNSMWLCVCVCVFSI